MEKSLKIVFMGTPDFSVPALEALHRSRHEIIQVMTQPDRPKGRGRKMMPTPVKKAALQMGYEVYQPESVRTPEFEEIIRNLLPDLMAVIAFGQILPRNILKIPPLGAINVHASLLPKYRGPAPIQWAVVNGDRETGVTAMQMDSGLDTGAMLMKAVEKIGPDDTAGDMHDRLSLLGAELLTDTLDRLDQLKAVPQVHGDASYAPLLKKKDGQIDWRRSAEELDCFIRGMSPWPGAFTFYEGRRLRLFKAKPLDAETDEKPGTALKSFPGELRIATGKGVLSILELQGASGKRLRIQDFLRGCDIPAGACLNE